MLSELEVLSPAAVLYDVVRPVPSSANLWALNHYKHYMGALPHNRQAHVHVKCGNTSVA